MSIGILIPSRKRVEILKACVSSLNTTKMHEQLEVIIVSDNDQETYEKARKFLFSGFEKYKVFMSPERLYSVGAFNYALSKCESELFFWIGDDAIFPDDKWIEYTVNMYSEAFPDGIGLLALSEGGPGQGLSSKSYLEYSGSSIYHSGYKVHYADTEAGLKARMLDKYISVVKPYEVGHVKALPETHPAMDPTTRYLFIQTDKRLFGERKEFNFFLSSEKIKNPLEEELV